MWEMLLVTPWFYFFQFEFLNTTGYKNVFISLGISYIPDHVASEDWLCYFLESGRRPWKKIPTLTRMGMVIDAPLSDIFTIESANIWEWWFAHHFLIYLLLNLPTFGSGNWGTIIWFNYYLSCQHLGQAFSQPKALYIYVINNNIYIQIKSFYFIEDTGQTCSFEEELV